MLLVLADVADSRATALAQNLNGVLVVAPDGAGSPSARLCAAIGALQPTPPLVVVAVGAAADHLPAVALSQRAAHRQVAEYLLVEAPIPAVSDAWPDAPVTVATDDTSVARQSVLRGWTTIASEHVATWRPAIA